MTTATTATLSAEDVISSQDVRSRLIPTKGGLLQITHVHVNLKEGVVGIRFDVLADDGKTILANSRMLADASDKILPSVLAAIVQDVEPLLADAAGPYTSVVPPEKLASVLLQQRDAEKIAELRQQEIAAADLLLQKMQASIQEATAILQNLQAKTAEADGTATTAARSEQ